MRATRLQSRACAVEPRLFECHAAGELYTHRPGALRRSARMVGQCRTGPASDIFSPCPVRSLHASSVGLSEFVADNSGKYIQQV